MRDWGWTFNAHCNQIWCLSILRSSNDNSHCHTAAPAAVISLMEGLSLGSHHVVVQPLSKYSLLCVVTDASLEGRHT